MPVHCPEGGQGSSGGLSVGRDAHLPIRLGAGGLFAILLGKWVRGAALAVLLLGFVPYLCGGLVLSIVLASRRRDKPAWLWGVSLGSAILFGLIAVGLIAVWILV